MQDVSFTAGEAATWKSTKITIETAQQWRELGFSALETLEWKDSGIDVEKEAKLWLKSGLNFQKIARFIKVGYSLEKADKKREI